MRYLLAVLCLALSALLFLAGCPTGPQEAVVPAPMQAPTLGAAAKYRLAVVPKGTSHVFWKTVQAGARAAGKELSAEILWNGPSEETDVSGQITILEDFLTQKVDAIVMAACDAEALVPLVQKAREQGVPVITIDSGIKTDDALCFVATDNLKGARMAGETLAELIGKKGQVGLIPFIKGAATSDMREQGFKEALAGFPEIKLVSTLYSQSDTTVATSKTEDMLTAYPKLAGLFAANEPAVVGAAQVLKQRGLAGKVKLVGFDASEAELEGLRDGSIQALIVQNPFRMGYDGVSMAVKALQKQTIPTRVDTGVVIVTRDNLNTPEIQQLLNPAL